MKLENTNFMKAKASRKTEKSVTCKPLKKQPKPLCVYGFSTKPTKKSLHPTQSKPKASDDQTKIELVCFCKFFSLF